MFSFKRSQSKRVFVAVDGARKLTRRGIRQAFFKIGDDLVCHARDLIRKPPKTGRLYRLPGRKKRHRASAPGQAPANRTGALAKSLDYQIRGNYEMEFGSKSEYAEFLENGTQKMKERPFLIRTVRDQERNTRFHLEAEVARELRQ